MSCNPMQSRVQRMKQAWDERERQIGLTKRAVLFKRFPTVVNELIHRRHLRFVLQNIPDNAEQLLDVGCGYGRISREIKNRAPAISLQGVDLCTEFAIAYEKQIGPCFSGPIQEFSTNSRFDAIIVVTCLMYLDVDEHRPTLQRLWTMLNPRGCLICIEPAIEVLHLWRRVTGRAHASPTGGSVCHFRLSDLSQLCTDLPQSSLQATASVNLIPYLAVSALHHGVAVKKGS